MDGPSCALWPLLENGQQFVRRIRRILMGGANDRLREITQEVKNVRV